MPSKPPPPTLELNYFRYHCNRTNRIVRALEQPQAHPRAKHPVGYSYQVQLTVVHGLQRAEGRWFSFSNVGGTALLAPPPHPRMPHYLGHSRHEITIMR